MTVPPLRALVLGAAGRDFHDVQTFFRARPDVHVVGITAAQIPFIATRSFPRELAGPGYDADIPIFDESRLPRLVRELGVDFVFLAYSDLSHVEVMHKASIAHAAGASFALLGPTHTQLRSERPVIAVTATRTGAGKSPISQALAAHFRARGRRVGVLRHPMPYGDLRAQRVQRFATEADLDRAKCTLEEREEYAPYVAMGLPVFAGVDYRAILSVAEREADLVLWDGGNNDFPFVRPDVWIVVCDALRAGHELAYHPGETNFRAADVVVISKVGRARPEDVAAIERHAAEVNPRATVCHVDLRVTTDRPAAIAGRRVLVVEDGPTITHGGMPSGAGLVAAREHGAASIVDPRPHARGTIAQAYAEFPHVGPVLPALGYSDAQRAELRDTITSAAPDVVVDASPAGVVRVLDLGVPSVRVSAAVETLGTPSLQSIVEERLPPAR